MALIYHQDPFTISFDEVGNAFESFYSYYPEMMGEVNTTLFSFKNGAIWQHTNTTYCNFYGVQGSASITTVFNSGALDKKHGFPLWKQVQIYGLVLSYILK